MLDERQKLHDGRLERISIEYRYLHPTQGQRWIHHVARVSARDAAGRTTRSYGAVRDITLQKQEHEALLQSYAEIEQLKERLQAEADYLKAEVKVTQDHGEVIGRSAAIRKVLRQAEQVAPTDSSVLIYGETGTGKELIAQTIHRLSSRGSRVMVKVNCAALPSALVESELFGREKGAFTGALMRQIGRFELADGSTIFLDELGELSLEVQAKLLRVLQEGQFERLGSPKTIKVNVRVIGATNRDLAEEVTQWGFPGRPVLPPERISHSRAPAPRSVGGHPADGMGLHRGILLPHGQEDHPGAAQNHGNAPAPLLARQRSRIAECDRAQHHHHDR